MFGAMGQLFFVLTARGTNTSFGGQYTDTSSLDYLRSLPSFRRKERSLPEVAFLHAGHVFLLVS